MRAVPVIAAALAVLSLAGTASAGFVGVNEDAPKLQPSLYQAIADAGLQQNVLSVIWNQGDSAPSAGQVSAINAAIAAAKAKDVKVVLAVYPGSGANARALAADGGAQFVAFSQNVASTFTGVTDFIEGNEPNRTIFMSPVEPALFTKVLANAYAAMKSVRPDATIIGVGLSPRGSGDPRNQGGGSLSMFPVQYLLAMGKAYRDQGLTGKIMDAISFHPYPFPEDKAPDRPSDWPIIGMADLGRLKQAIFDAFAGTGQPTDLPIHLDEVAYQVPTEGKGGYTGAETVKTVDEATQATYYALIVNQVACDPRIASLSFFHFIDEAERGRFQSGFQDANSQARPVLAGIKQALSETAGGTKCNGTPVNWAPATGVLGASAVTDATGKQKLSNGSGVWGATLTATEDADFLAGLFRDGTTADQAAAALAGSGALKPIQQQAGKVSAQIARLAKFELSRGVPPGKYLYGAVLSVATPGGKRTQTLVTTSFQVGKPGATTTAPKGPTCPKGLADAGRQRDNGCEVNLLFDLRNCGRVGNVVALVAHAAGVACHSGKPRVKCRPGFRDVDKLYANGCESGAARPRDNPLLFDLRNCGAAGHVVALVANAAGIDCNRGKPRVTCIPGFKDSDKVYANGCERALPNRKRQALAGIVAR